jgi:predicted nucleotidyltransferase
MTSDQPLPLDDLADALADADFAILFGSAVSNRLTEDSDLDIAVSFRSRLSWRDFAELRAQLEEVVHRPVDLVDLSTVDPILKMQVVRHGRLLLVNDSSAYHAFQMYTIAQYLDVKILRRPVEEAMIQGRTA